MVTSNNAFFRYLKSWLCNCFEKENAFKTFVWPLGHMRNTDITYFHLQMMETCWFLHFHGQDFKTLLKLVQHFIRNLYVYRLVSLLNSALWVCAWDVSHVPVSSIFATLWFTDTAEEEHWFDDLHFQYCPTLMFLARLNKCCVSSNKRKLWSEWKH